MNFIPREYDQDSKKKAAQLCKKSGKSISEAALNQCIKKDSTIDANETKISLSDNQDYFFDFLLNERNIIVDTEMKDRLEAIQRLASIGIIVRGIVHDFNNILSPILGNIELLLLDIPEVHQYKEPLLKIRTSSLRAKDLINQIISLSSQKDNGLRDVKVQDCIKEVLILIRSSIPNNINIIQDIDACCHAIEADQTIILQVIMNLVINAYHAMEKTGGELKIILSAVEFKKPNLLSSDMKPGIYACLTVSDTGIGIEKKILEKIFTPFFTTKKDGTGLGLSVVNSIIKRLKGYIKIKSSPGIGTEINIYIRAIQITHEKKNDMAFTSFNVDHSF